MEVLSWNPYLIQIHEAFGPKFLNHIKQSAVQDMERTPSANSEDSHLIYSYGSNATRTSFSSVLFEQNEEDALVLHPFERKIEAMTQLAVSNAGLRNLSASVSVAEQLQVSAYVFGGQYTPHLDAEVDGDRVATFMVYVSTYNYNSF